MTIEWVRPRPDRNEYRRDVIAAVLVGVGATVTLLLYLRVGVFDEPAPPWLCAVVIAVSSLPLAARRRFPEAIAVIISIGFFLGQQFSVPELLFSNIALFVAIYTLGAWGRDRRRATLLRIGIIAAMFLWIAVRLVIDVSNPELMPQFSRSGIFSQFATYAVINVITNILYFGGAYYFGNSAWAAARARAELEASTAELALEREFSSQQAVALDRVRIARELHDVVAHHVSVMGVQAGAARRVIDSDQAQARSSLETIESSARSAVDELHRLLTTLRENETDVASESSSTRGLAQLPALVSEATATGTPSNLLVVGAERPVTSLTGFTIYRVAQEALTNARKHGGDRASVDVRLRFLAGAVELEVTDTGSGRTTARVASTTGLGLVGMRERVAAVGGVLEVGPRSSGGYLVRARIPDATATA